MKRVRVLAYCPKENVIHLDALPIDEWPHTWRKDYGRYALNTRFPPFDCSRGVDIRVKDDAIRNARVGHYLTDGFPCWLIANRWQSGRFHSLISVQGVYGKQYVVVPVEHITPDF